MSGSPQLAAVKIQDPDLAQNPDPGSGAGSGADPVQDTAPDSDSGSDLATGARKGNGHQQSGRNCMVFRQMQQGRITVPVLVP